MKKFEINQLNDEQQRALLAIDGPVLVTAGAGSGKTRLLTYRIAYLIEELGVMPYEVLAITFTNKAAKEMQERVVSLIDGGDGVWISTFHSMCVRILRKYIDKLGGSYNKNFTIFSDTDTERVLKDIADQLKYSGKDKEEFVKTCGFHIANIKNNNFDPVKYELENDYVKDIKNIINCYNLYEDYLEKSNCLDFDDLLIKTYDLLVNNDDVLDYYSNRFKYILVDEFQDTNQIQYDIVKILAKKRRNIFVVGDEDQCIYSWRGANYKNISNFKKDFEECKVYKLEKNYRSTKKIISSANTIIKLNRSRIDKTLYTDNEEGADIIYYPAGDEMTEADFVAGRIKQLIASGVKPSSIAVLIRLNALTYAFEDRFMSYGVPYKVYGGFKFYDRAEIKNIVAYLRLFVNPNDEVAFLRIINFPKRGIGDGAIAKLKEYSATNNKNLLESCIALSQESVCPNSLIKFANFGKVFTDTRNELEKLALDEFCEKVISNFNIKLGYDTSKEGEIDKLLNIDSFIMSANEYVKANPNLTLADFLESIALISDLDDENAVDDTVKLATIHSVKGLEFDAVFVCGLEEKIFPISRAFDRPEDLEEERRLMYVAMTRARKILYLTRAKSRFMYGKRDYMIPSRFLGELGYDGSRKTSFISAETSSQKSFSTNTGSSNSYYINPFNKTTINNISNVNNCNLEGNKKDISVFEAGQKISHARYGLGAIISVDLNDRTADIIFDGYGKKTLMLDIAPLEIIK